MSQMIFSCEVIAIHPERSMNVRMTFNGYLFNNCHDISSEATDVTLTVPAGWSTSLVHTGMSWQLVDDAPSEEGTDRLLILCLST